MCFTGEVLRAVGITPTPVSPDKLADLLQKLDASWAAAVEADLQGCEGEREAPEGSDWLAATWHKPLAKPLLVFPELRPPQIQAPPEPGRGRGARCQGARGRGARSAATAAGVPALLD